MACAVAVAAVGVPLVAGCATGFGAPTRNAVANLQAASVIVGNDLRINGLIVALPNDEAADKGGVAYIQFSAANLSTTPDKLVAATAKIDIEPTASGGAVSTAAPQAVDVSSQQLPIGSTDIPAKNATTPGEARITVALDPLEVPLQVGESVKVTLTFANHGSADSIATPVLGQAAVGTFLPSASPTLPSSAPPVSAPPVSAPPASAPASPPASAPASGSASSPAST